MPSLHSLSDAYTLSRAEIGLLGSGFEAFLVIGLVVAAGMAATLLVRSGSAEPAPPVR